MRELALLIEGLAEWEGADLAAPAVGQEGSAASAGSGPGPAASAPSGAAPAAASPSAVDKSNPEQGRSGFGDVRSPDGGTTAGKPNPEQIRQKVLAVRAEAFPYWTELIQTCPSSPYQPEALYHAGRLLAEAAWMDSPAQDSPPQKSPPQDSPA